MDFLNIGYCIVIICILKTYQTADIVIEIPGNLGQDDSSYRLDYYPPFGNPEPNTTIASRDVGDEIQFSNVLAGTKYDFNLFYTNATLHNFLAWTVSITTGQKMDHSCEKSTYLWAVPVKMYTHTSTTSDVFDPDFSEIPYFLPPPANCAADSDDSDAL